MQAHSENEIRDRSGLCWSNDFSMQSQVKVLSESERREHKQKARDNNLSQL